MYYRIVTGRNLVDLESNVNERIKTGWRPVGGLMVQGSLYAQAMLLEQNNP